MNPLYWQLTNEAWMELDNLTPNVYPSISPVGGIGEKNNLYTNIGISIDARVVKWFAPQCRDIAVCPCWRMKWEKMLQPWRNEVSCPLWPQVMVKQGCHFHFPTRVTSSALSQYSVISAINRQLLHTQQWIIWSDHTAGISPRRCRCCVHKVSNNYLHKSLTGYTKIGNCELIKSDWGDLSAMKIPHWTRVVMYKSHKAIASSQLKLPFTTSQLYFREVRDCTC